MKVLICLSGKIHKEILQDKYKKADYVIAADGGGNILFDSMLLPDILLGDLDSISNDALNFFLDKNITIEEYPVEKDYTDGELALIKAINLNPKEVTILGAIGSRLDHVFGNIGLLYKLLLNDIQGKIVDKNNIIMMTNKNTNIKAQYGFRFSILPYSDNVRGLSIEGGKYNLHNHDLGKGETITISNEFKDEFVKVTLKEGIILIIISKDDDL